VKWTYSIKTNTWINLSWVKLSDISYQTSKQKIRTRKTRSQCGNFSWQIILVEQCFQYSEM